MKKLNFLSVLFTIFTISILNAQENIGIDYFRLGEYDLSKKYFEKQLANAPAESNFYLGEIAFIKGQLNDAKTYYTTGLNADPNHPLNEIGLAKLELKTNQKAAESAFNSIQKKHNTTVDVKIAIGYAYLQSGLTDKAMNEAEGAAQIDKKNPRVYILQGDILKASQTIGEAVGKYDMAIYFDPNYPLPYIKESEIYENTNWQVALDKLKAIVALRPDYTITYRNLGKLYTGNGFYPQAVEAYKTYFTAGYYTLEDISRYVTALYFNKQYENIGNIINEGLIADPNHFVLNRLQLYTAAHMKDYASGLNYAEHFFSLKKDSADAYISKDYAMYAIVLKDAKIYDKATAQYKKALLMDPTYIDLYKEMANVASLKGQNGYAADLYKLYMDKAGEKVEALDYFQLGRYYYNAANVRTAVDTTNLINLRTDNNFISKISNNEHQKDSILKDPNLLIKKAVEYYLKSAESAFDEVVSRIPDGYTGYLWKARTNSLMDPESEAGLAKPYYEKTIEILLEKKETNNSINSILIEAYSYLGYYYFLKDDKINIPLYWNKVLELDPQNQNANTVLKQFKK